MVVVVAVVPDGAIELFDAPAVVAGVVAVFVVVIARVVETVVVAAALLAAAALASATSFALLRRGSSKMYQPLNTPTTPAVKKCKYRRLAMLIKIYGGKTQSAKDDSICCFDSVDYDLLGI